MGLLPVAILVAWVVDGLSTREKRQYPRSFHERWSPKAPEAFAHAMREHTRRLGTPRDCAVRRFAYKYALHLKPGRAPLRDVFDALELHTLCGDPEPSRDGVHKRAKPARMNADMPKWYVDPVSGDDSNSGSKAEPFRSIERAIAESRKAEFARAARAVVLREGLHAPNATIQLGKSDSKLTIMAYPGERSDITGAQFLPTDLKWTRYSGRPDDNVWKAQIPEGWGPDPEALVMASGPNARDTTRQTRARHPNRDPSSGTIENGLWSPEGTVWTKPNPWPAPATTVFLQSPNDAIHHAGGTPTGTGGCGTHFTYGLGGVCDRYTPQGGYLCSKYATGGGFGWEEMVPGAPSFPVGLSVPGDAFKQAGVPPPAEWASINETGAKPVVETWTNGWCTTFWEVDSIRSGQGNMTFGRGGQQTGRGFHADNNDPSGPITDAGPWFVENALELLDQPEEWFYAPKTRTIYVYLNETGTPADYRWLVPRLTTLINATGTLDDPIVGLQLQGVGFRDTAPTYLGEWGVPSGGDWALHRGGGVFFQGVRDAVVNGCRFRDMGGNAVFLSGFTRNVTVSDTEFRFIGDSAVAAWGFTRALGNETESLPDGVGIDGTGGEQPRGTRIVGNIVSDIGMSERQSSAWGEFKACSSEVRGNIFYNMPRAAININDGFGGGTSISDNLIFNTCRESGDHGPFNSWDRQPYLTNVRGDGPSFVPANNTISRNFIIANYGAGWGVDNDDTSSYYDIVSNFMYGGGGVKCDYAGHDKYFHENVLVDQIGGGACHHTCAYKKPFTDHCYNNTIVQADLDQPGDLGQTSDPYAVIWFCTARDPRKIMPDYDNSMLPEVHSNRIYNSNGKMTNVTCGYTGNEKKELVPLSRFTDVGLMKDTTVSPLPSDDQIIGWGKAALGVTW